MLEKDAYLVLGADTYGYYRAKTQEFTCTHGAWTSQIKFLDDNHCIVREVSRTDPMTYKVIDAIPEDFN